MRCPAAEPPAAKGQRHRQRRAGGGAPRLSFGTGYYGWVLVGALGATEAISWGVLYYAFGVFLEPMGSTLGWSRGELTGAFSLALLVSGVTAVPVGRWLDRHGPRLLMTGGSCCGTVLVVLWSRVADLGHFYLLWAAIGATMATVLYEPAFAVVAQWFDRKRARALTVVTLIAGFSSTIFLPLAGWLVQAQGWRPALVTLAVLLAVGTIPPHALLLRRRPEDLGLYPDGAPAPAGGGRAIPVPGVPLGVAVRDRTLSWLALAFCLATFVGFGATLHLVPILLERGYTATDAASLAGLVGAMQVVGRVILGLLDNRLPLRGVAAGVMALQPVALLALLLVPGAAGVILFVLLFGAARGGLTLIRPAFVAQLYGRAAYASVAGVLAFAATVAQALAPVSIGTAYDGLGRYEPILWALVVVSGAAIAALGPTRQPGVAAPAR